MAGERRAIREGIKAAIEADLVMEVIASRVYDTRGKSNFVSIFFDSGDDEYEGIQVTTTAQIIVGYFVKDLVDDNELDAVADLIYEAIENTDIAPDVVQGIIPTGFAYVPESETSFSGIVLRFNVRY